MWRLYTILLLSIAFSQSTHSQFLGGSGDGIALAQEANPDPCSYFFGDTTSGATRTTLANPDTCGFFDGSFSDGFEMFNLSNPDSCGFFEGNLEDGFAMGYMPSPVACPTFYGSSRSGFALGYLNCTPLEVTATPLYGKMEGPNAHLWWHTHSELNNLGFHLLRSEDRLQWVEVAWMDGSNASNAMRKYEHSDEEKPIGLSYYRWRQVDLDGSSSYSNTVALLKTAQNGSSNLIAYPVPLTAGETFHLHFSSPDQEEVTITIVDLFGKILMQDSQAKSTEQLSLSYHSSTWSAGSYIVILDQGGRRFTQRIVIL